MSEHDPVQWHAVSAEDALKRLTSKAEGLSEAEAKKRLAQYGPNEFKRTKRRGPLSILASQFKDVMILILLGAGAVSLYIGHSEGGPWYLQISDAAVILIIVILNALFGFFQESKAESAIESLKKLTSPHAFVFRNGKPKEVDSKELIPGDVVRLEAGNFVPADLRLIEAQNLCVNERSLTGESESVFKHTNPLKKGKTLLADRKNMIYQGTLVEGGRGLGLVVATGMTTEMGLIAGLIQESPDESTPLQKKLKKLGITLGIAVVGICIFIFALEMIKEGMGQLLKMFEVAVSLSVAAIPEGLPAVVTICLALGIQRMVKRHVVIRNLASVETLGSATVICTDKTGTLTTNEMDLKRISLMGRELEVSGSGYGPKGDFKEGGKKVDPATDDNVLLLLKAGTLCCDAALGRKEGRYIIIGDTTEGALVVASEKAGFPKGKLDKDHPRIGEVPFDSRRKMMTTVHKAGKAVWVCTKGAPESVLHHCTHIMTGDGPVPITEAHRASVLERTLHLAEGAFRTLGIAYNELNAPPEKYDTSLESDLTYIGTVGIQDTIRPEAIKAAKVCRDAGIRVVMITGDHKITAKAVAKELGIIRPGDEVVDGAELDEMDDATLRKKVQAISVYARVSPEHKMRIIEAWKVSGQVVAMTGDGVNDAPALKRADIGVAMGVTGTDVAKEASDLVIMDDNFSSIVSAVEEGRTIYANIRKVIQFLLSCNLGEVLTMFVGILIGLPLPMLPLQILWMNLVTDGLPALALSQEPPEPGVMKRKPFDPKEGAIGKEMLITIIISGAILAGFALLMFKLHDHYGYNEDHSRTITFVFMIVGQMFVVLGCRSTHHSLSEIGWMSNPKLLGAMALSIALTVPLVYVPFLQVVFSTTALSLFDWAKVLILSFGVLAAIEIWEIIRTRRKHWL